jgi:hypothetical protein
MKLTNEQNEQNEQNEHTNILTSTTQETIVNVDQSTPIATIEPFEAPAQDPPTEMIEAHDITPIITSIPDDSEPPLTDISSPPTIESTTITNESEEEQLPVLTSLPDFDEPATETIPDNIPAPESEPTPIDPTPISTSTDQPDLTRNATFSEFSVVSDSTHDLTRQYTMFDNDHPSINVAPEQEEEILPVLDTLDFSPVNKSNQHSGRTMSIDMNLNFDAARQRDLLVELEDEDVKLSNALADLDITTAVHKMAELQNELFQQLNTPIISNAMRSFYEPKKNASFISDTNSNVPTPINAATTNAAVVPADDLPTLNDVELPMSPIKETAPVPSVLREPVHDESSIVLTPEQKTDLTKYDELSRLLQMLWCQNQLKEGMRYIGMCEKNGNSGGLCYVKGQIIFDNIFTSFDKLFVLFIIKFRAFFFIVCFVFYG